MTAPVRVVHVVAKTHLDLGFTASAAAVTAQYLDDFFPRAMETATTLRAEGDGARLVWTTGSWILHQALNHGPAGRRAAVADAVARGDLAWHALALTTHTELADADLIRADLAISDELDDRFATRTTAAKMTDVPGHTRAMVPLLAEAGVTFLHLGVNPAWPVPEVAPVFRWRSPDGAEVVVAYGRGGYGGEVRVEGCDEVLAFLHGGDNLGPPSATAVVGHHAALAERYPGAEVRGSTLDRFARALARSDAVEHLPVVTAEIGDPWLFGAGSDPLKVAAYREVLRGRRQLPAATSPVVRAEIDRTLLLVAEHTCGLDHKATVDAEHAWDRAGLAALRSSDQGRRMEASWREQRSYVDRAADLVWATARQTGRPPYPPPSGPGATVGAEGEGGDDRSWGHVEAMAVPRWPMGNDGTPQGGFEALAPSAVVGGAGWQLAVSPESGALELLVHTGDGRVLADASHPLGLVGYESFDEADYERFYAGLTPEPGDDWWARLDNTKPGIDAGGARSGWSRPTVTGTWHATQQRGTWHTVLVRMAFAAPLCTELGAPAEVWARWSWCQGADELDLDLWWPDKAPSRLPEALWCQFVPIVAEPDRWTVDKLGQAVSPLDVVRRGGRALHAVGDGMAYDGPDGAVRIHTVDAPLVAPGRPGLLEADPPVPDLAEGFGVLLADNCWGTNFPMWISGPARFRFTVSIS